MKRKLLMMSFAMMAGLPHAVFAKGGEKGFAAQSYASWNGAYMPHYGSEGAKYPLMDHLTASPSASQDADANKWRLEFGLPRADLMGVQDPSMGKGAGAGVSLKLDF
jgi:hypothetical protein